MWINVRIRDNIPSTIYLIHIWRNIYTLPNIESIPMTHGTLYHFFKFKTMLSFNVHDVETAAVIGLGILRLIVATTKLRAGKEIKIDQHVKIAYHLTAVRVIIIIIRMVEDHRSIWQCEIKREALTSWQTIYNLKNLNTHAKSDHNVTFTWHVSWKSERGKIGFSSFGHFNWR